MTQKPTYEELEQKLKEFESDVVAPTLIKADFFPETTYTEAIINSLPGGFYVCDEHLRLIRWNKNFEELSGYTAQELLNKSSTEFYDGEDLDKISLAVDRVFKDGEAIVEAHFINKKGTRALYIISGRLITRNKKKYIIGVSFDISNLKKAEQALGDSERKLGAIINHHFQLTGLLDPSGRILLANQTALKLVDIKADDVLGKYFWETPWWVHSQELQKQVQEGIRKAAKGGFVRFEVTHPDIHGVLRLHDFSLSPVQDEHGQIIYIVPEARDITEIKQTESDLREALKELEELKNRLEDENVYLKEEIKLDHNFGEIVGQSKVLKKILYQVEQVASTDATVLILGETGTGKELIARAVHELSSRKRRPLVKVNCAALPANLIESELFGHEKGAFSGAFERKIGRFELAHRGTIFLDEIGDLPLDLQTKLLRVLQEGEFERLGNPKTIHVDVRILAATNRNLNRSLKKGLFREDLFYRLNVYPITCPPMRERVEDLPLLVKHFVDKYGIKVGKKIDIIPKKVMKTLASYHWPGNVRELENIIERAMVINQGKTLQIGDWLPQVAIKTQDAGLPTLSQLERNHILKVMNLTNWRVRGAGGAAEKLGLKPTTLEARMKKLDIRRA